MTGVQTCALPICSDLMAHLKSQGIETTVYYPVALHQQPAFKPSSADAASCPEAARAAAEVLSLPMYPELTAAQQQRVAGRVRLGGRFAEGVAEHS